MLENCFKIMTGFAVTAEPPVIIEFREERTTAALLTRFVFLSALRFVMPFEFVEVFTSGI